MVLCLIAAFVLTACVGPQTKTGKGAAVGTAGGAAVGAGIGQLIGKDTESTLIGAGVGAAVGAAAGAGIGHMMDKQEQEFNQALAASNAAAVRREGNQLAITLKGDVSFDTGSDQVKSELYSELDRISKVMVNYPDTRIIVEGHTDSVGKESSNMDLSRRRAESVKTLLIQRGVGASRVQVVAFGESQPISDNGTAAGRQKNRRVEIKVEPTS